MLSKVNEAIRRYGMEDILDGAIIGFSGGADSSALLHFLKDRCKCLLAVHINHMIRGAEADRDEEACRAVCEKYGVAFKSFRVDVPRLAAERKQGLEETAREERYKIFYDLLSKNPQYKRIVTAHNANDNAETIVFNLTRGSGINGLCGIKPVYGSVVRPLIFSSRDEIIKYCQDNNIKYVTDSTNADTDYTRNRIRHNVLPELLKINPNLIAACTRLGEILRQDEEYIFGAAKSIFDTLKGGRLEKSVAQELDAAVLSRVLKLMCPHLDYVGVKECEGLICQWKTGKRLNVGCDTVFKIEYDYCHFVSSDSISVEEFYAPLTEGKNEICNTGLTVFVNEECRDRSLTEVGRVRLNPAHIVGELYVRNKWDGDTVKSAGVTKKLKRVFADLHIPSEERLRLPVICDEQGPVAVPGIVARDGAFDKKGDLIIKVYKKST